MVSHPFQHLKKMALWCRLKPSQVKNLSNQLKRCYSQVHGSSAANKTASQTRVLVLDKPRWVIHSRQFEFFNNVRFYAAPVKVKLKQEENPSGPRLNEQITARYVRLVTDQGHGVVPRHEALERAQQLKLDLVEVQRNAKPPVCKLMDYHKEKYEQEVRQKNRAKSKSEMTLRTGDFKEVRFEPQIEEKDLQMKADMVKRFMERGYRVKCMARGTKTNKKSTATGITTKEKWMACGSEDQDLGGLLSRLSALIKDVAIVESGPIVAEKQAYVIVRHTKFGPSKKGSGKKTSKVGDTSSTDVQKVDMLSTTIKSSAQKPFQFEENLNGAESGLETDSDILSEDTCIFTPIQLPDEDREKNGSLWSVFNAEEDYEKCFDLKDDVHGVANSSSHETMRTAAKTSCSPTSISSEFMGSIPALDSTSMHEVPLSPMVASPGTENRYKREPRNRFAGTRSMDVDNPGAGDSTGVEHQSLNRGRHPCFDYVSSSTRETEAVETDASMFRQLKFSANKSSKQENLHPSTPCSPPSNYGIFSARRANDGSAGGSAQTEVNRYKKGSSINSPRNRTSAGHQ